MDHATILNAERLGVAVAPISSCDLHVGVVSYLNTKPLIFGLQSLAPSLRVHVDVPSQLAGGLRAGRLDVALVPVLEYFSRPDYGLLDESAICGNGRVRSVLLFSRVPIERVKAISLDPESLTTNALVKVLCRFRFQIEPRWAVRRRASDPADVLARGESDAVVVIGNAALAMAGRFPHEYDLGQEWWRLSGLPFVFALWAVRPGAEAGDLGDVLRASLRLGLGHLELIARHAADVLALDPGLCHQYLREMIQYNLTERAWQGMSRFFAMCAELDLCPSQPPRDLAQWVERV